MSPAKSRPKYTTRSVSQTATRAPSRTRNASSRYAIMDPIVMMYTDTLPPAPIRYITAGTRARATRPLYANAFGLYWVAASCATRGSAIGRAGTSIIGEPWA
eukprot:8527185-Pyramimonas_sp.AAC.2